MRKVTIIFMLISMFFGLSGCTTKHLSVEQSKKNFDYYQESLQKVVAEYGYVISEQYDKNIEDQNSYKDLRIILRENEQLNIRMMNSTFSSAKGIESFSIEYTLVNDETQNNFNTKLFIDLVNTISGKSITKEFCDEFLGAPESKYPAEKFGFKKLNGEKIAKNYALNFWEDWTINYVMDKQNEEVLIFGGLTKQLDK